MTKLDATIIGTRDISWVDESACADMPLEDFFVNAGHTIKSEVVAVCRSCPARMDCLLYAYESEPPMLGSGYYAGMSPGERKRHDLPAAAEYVLADSGAFFDSRPDLKRPEWLAES